MRRPSLDETLAGIAADTLALGFKLSSDASTGALLRTLAASKPAGNLLELGTGTGHGTAWLLAGMDSAARLTSVDVDARFQAVALKYHGRDSRCRFITENAGDWLARQAPGSFDLIFADAWPGKLSHLDEALAMLRPGGLYVVDDLAPLPGWDPAHLRALETFLACIESDPRLITLRLDWATGVAICVRIE